MKRSKTQIRLIFSNTQTKRESYHTLGKEGYLGMLKICLPIFREKKSGTSVKALSSPSYSTFLSPPPIRPMVEKYPIYETAAIKIRIQKLIEECT